MDALGEVALLISRLQRSPASDLDAATVAALERLLTLARDLDEADAGSLCAGSPRVAAYYGRYVQRRETEEARALIERGADSGSLGRGEGGEFAGRSFARVRDMFGRVDFSACRELVMVGCGPLPVTLLHVAKETDVARIIGLDIDEASVRSAREICDRWAPARIQVLHRDGCDYDYAAADVVYVANLVRSKASVLTRVASSTRPRTQVIVREPFAAGCLFAEHGIDRRDRRLKLLARGPGDRRFLSRHVFLERTQEAGPAGGGCRPA